MKSITILLLIFTTMCSSQTTFKSIQNDIVELYISKNEIQKENKEKILDNFKESAFEYANCSNIKLFTKS